MAILQARSTVGALTAFESSLSLGFFLVVGKFGKSSLSLRFYLVVGKFGKSQFSKCGANSLCAEDNSTGAAVSLWFSPLSVAFRTSGRQEWKQRVTISNVKVHYLNSLRIHQLLLSTYTAIC